MPDLRSPQAPPRSAADLFGDPVDAYPPWLNPTAFASQEFDPESYISDLRTFVPLETLRSDLQSHLSSLQRELVDLINRDYSDFVSLSTKLIDIDASVVRMRAPLLDIKEKILAFRAAVDSSLGALKSRLKQRGDANQTREVLEVLLDTFHVVSKVRPFKIQWAFINLLIDLFIFITFFCFYVEFCIYVMGLEWIRMLWLWLLFTFFLFGNLKKFWCFWWGFDLFLAFCNHGALNAIPFHFFCLVIWEIVMCLTWFWFIFGLLK